MKLATLDKISVFLAELIGTGMLVFLGCMGCISWNGQPLNHLQVVLNFGIAVMLIIQIFGCVSGAHLNPAVTAAAMVYRLVNVPTAIMYFIAQMLGAFMGFGLLKVITPAEIFRPDDATGPGLCSTVPRSDLTVIQALSVEFLATMILILICCGVWDPRNAKHHDSLPLRFGLAIAGLACAIGPYTGASMNPARSFAPALWNGDFHMHWIYWVGPMTAGFLTAFVFKAVFWRDPAIQEQHHHISANKISDKLKSEVELPLRDRNNV